MWGEREWEEMEREDASSSLSLSLSLTLLSTLDGRARAGMGSGSAARVCITSEIAQTTRYHLCSDTSTQDRASRVNCSMMTYQLKLIDEQTSLPSSPQCFFPAKYDVPVPVLGLPPNPTLGVEVGNGLAPPVTLAGLAELSRAACRASPARLPGAEVDS